MTSPAASPRPSASAPSSRSAAEILKRSSALRRLPPSASRRTSPTRRQRTVDDNVDEPGPIDAAKASAEKPVRSFREAKLLEPRAFSTSDGARADRAGPPRRDAEKRTRSQAVVDNNAFLEKLEAKVRAWKAGDRRQRHDARRSRLRRAVPISDRARASPTQEGDPFSPATIAVLASSTHLGQVTNDRDGLLEVCAAQGADTQLDTRRAWPRSQSDGIADSPRSRARARARELSPVYRPLWPRRRPITANGDIDARRPHHERGGPRRRVAEGRDRAASRDRCHFEPRRKSARPRLDRLLRRVGAGPPKRLS